MKKEKEKHQLEALMVFRLDTKKKKKREKEENQHITTYINYKH